MSDGEKVREITIHVRDRDGEAVRHLEGPTAHETADDLAAEMVGGLESRNPGKLKHLAGTDR